MRTLRAGLVLAVLLGLADLTAPLGGGDAVPMPVAIGAAVLGLITVVGAILAWSGRRAAVITVVVARVLSALSALPAFFVADAPPVARVVAAVVVALTVVAVALLMPRLRSKTVPA